jgi:N-acetylmuramic acid 6-phosphate etherase
MTDYARLPTEQPNPQSRRLDVMPLERLALLMNHEDARVVAAVRRVRGDVVRAVKLIVASLRGGGRLFFAGAGTSGRLGVLEAAECPPTFNTPPDLIQAFMAGGRPSVFRSREGAEDRALDAERAVRRGVRRGDVLVGVAASGVTPYVLAALDAARRRRARTVLVTCNPSPELRRMADVVIGPAVGPEVLTGSTRLKAGTATKLVLNALTTLSMVRLGKVYRHWMVDLQPRSRKLRARAARLIRHLGRVTEEEAAALLRKAGGSAKTAVVMARRGVSADEARRLIRRAGGFLHKILR